MIQICRVIGRFIVALQTCPSLQSVHPHAGSPSSKFNFFRPDLASRVSARLPALQRSAPWGASHLSRRSTAACF
jgi:hypothetical protein